MNAPDGSSGRKKKRARQRAEFEATVADIEAQVRATNAKIEAQVRATNAKIEQRTGRNLPLAIIIGLALGLALVFSLVVIKELFLIFAAFLLVFTVFELASALRFAGRNVPRIPTIIGGLAVVPAAFFWLAEGQWLGILGAMLLVTLWRLAEAVVPARRTSALDLGKDLVAGVFIQAYVVFLGSFAVLLTAQDGGEWWTLAFLIVVVSTDTGAYATGLLAGRHPMAPKISPKKTWEGFAGSLLAAVIAGVLVALFMIGQPWTVGLLFGVTLALTATLGDLTESLIKRDLGIKDISTWLPGHGGFLDRLDSILPSAAVAYAFYRLFA